MARITTGLALAAALAQAQPAQALSNAARYLAEQEIAAGCESGAGASTPRASSSATSTATGATT